MKNLVLVILSLLVGVINIIRLYLNDRNNDSVK